MDARRKKQQRGHESYKPYRPYFDIFSKRVQYTRDRTIKRL